MGAVIGRWIRSDSTVETATIEPKWSVAKTTGPPGGEGRVDGRGRLDHEVLPRLPGGGRAPEGSA